MLINDNEYLSIIENVKERIKSAQYRATLAVNSELIELYWNIGVIINEYSVWGNKFVENLARDIKFDFPNAQGYSVRNLKYMAKFARTYPDIEFVQRTVAQIPWRHNVALLDKVKDEAQRIWYAQKIIENGWSRDWLVTQIEYQLYERQALAEKTTNFPLRLAPPQSDLAEQTMKDPYIFDFVRNEKDNPTIGILLCRNKRGMIKSLVVEMMGLDTAIKKVSISFNFMSVERKKKAADSSAYDINIIVAALNGMLDSLSQKPLVERKFDFTSKEKTIWLDEYKDLTDGNFDIIFKSARYNQSRNVIDTQTMTEVDSKKKEPQEGDEYKTHLCIRRASQEERFIAIVEQNNDGLFLSEIKWYLNQKLETYHTENGGAYSYSVDCFCCTTTGILI